MTRHELNTERLRLEPTRVEHAPIVYDKVTDERLWTYFPELRPKSLAELQALYRRWERGNPDPGLDEYWENWICFLKGTQTPIGGMQATILSNGIAYMAYILYTDYHRKGFAREAALGVIEHLRANHGVRRVLLEMDINNEGSQRLAQSMGFTRIEERKNVERRYGLFGDEYVYALDL